MTSRIEIRNDEKGGFDELIAKAATIHFEMMDDNILWVGIETADQHYALWISARGKLTISAEDQTDRIEKAP